MSDSRRNIRMMKRAPIAVVGMAGIFPGAPDLPTYWRNIVTKVDANREVPPDRWIADAERMVNRTPTPDRAFHRRGCFVDPSLATRADSISRRIF